MGRFYFSPASEEFYFFDGIQFQNFIEGSDRGFLGGLLMVTEYMQHLPLYHI